MNNIRGEFNKQKNSLGESTWLDSQNKPTDVSDKANLKLAYDFVEWVYLISMGKDKQPLSLVLENWTTFEFSDFLESYSKNICLFDLSHICILKLKKSTSFGSSMFINAKENKWYIIEYFYRENDVLEVTLKEPKSR